MSPCLVKLVLFLLFPLAISSEDVTRTRREIGEEPCEDIKSTAECSEHMTKGHCEDPSTVETMAEMCAWTCGFCEFSGFKKIQDSESSIQDVKEKEEEIENTNEDKEMIREKRIEPEEKENDVNNQLEWFEQEMEKDTESKTNLPKCGRTSVPSSRVIAGKDASLGEWPWQAWLHIKNMGFSCGGSLIAPQWVLTAAHCILKTQPSAYKVTLGDVHRNKKEGTEEVFGVIKIKVHPKYQKPVPINNDVALLKLNKPAVIGSFVNMVCLPKPYEMVPVGKPCFVTGWGMVHYPDESGIVLQQGRMAVVSSTVCQSRVAPNTSIITTGMICAGDAGKTKTSACFGDSGGPFVCRNTAGQWVQQGVVSWGGFNCSSAHHFSVFARVSMYRNWLENNIKADY